jgi:hypothetical protein
MDWEHEIYKLWIAYFVWVRDYIYLLMRRQGNIQYVVEGLDRFINAFVDFWTQFYGKQNAEQLGNLLRHHIDLLAEYTATIHENEATEPLRGLWYANANDTAQFLAAQNPNWDEATWRDLLQTQFYLEERLIWTLHNNGYAETISQYEDLYNNLDKIITYTIDGIKKQFGGTAS